MKVKSESKVAHILLITLNYLCYFLVQGVSITQLEVIDPHMLLENILMCAQAMF